MECKEEEKHLNHGLAGTLGGICFRRVTETEFQYRADIRDIHLNSGGATHGGYMMTFLDTGMGTAVRYALEPEQRAVTISMSINFMAATAEGDTIIGAAYIKEKTRSLVFMHGEVRCRGQIVASAEGIWKIL